MAFAGSFGLYRFHDDWTFVFRAHDAWETGVAAFVLGPIEQHWSPLWHLVEASNFALVGWENDALIRVLQIASQALALVVACLFARRANLGLVATVTSVLVVAVHHANAAAIYSFDTYSQCAADALGWLGVWMFLTALDAPQKRRPTVGSIVLVLAALLFKEQALAAVGVCATAAALRPMKWGRRLRLAGPVIGVALAFALVRHAAGVSLQREGAFALAPQEIPANVALLGGALLSPVRTLAWFDALRSQPPDYRGIALLCIVTFGLGVAVLGGWRRRARLEPATWTQLRLLLAALIVSFFPVSLMSHVGELYTHTALLWFALLVGLAVDGWMRQQESRSSPVGRAAVIGVVAVWVVGLAIGLRQNLGEMRATGERARHWLLLTRAALATVPDGAVVFVTHAGASKGPTDYGLYRLTKAPILVLTGESPWSVRFAGGCRHHVIQGVDPLDEQAVAAAGLPPGPRWRLRYDGDAVFAEPVSSAAGD